MLKAPLRQESDSGDVPDPELPTGSMNTEPAASPDFCAPSPAPQLSPTAASPMDDPSQEWRLVKIKRVLIAPSSEPRKASKDFLIPLKSTSAPWGCSIPSKQCGWGPSHPGRRVLGPRCALGLFLSLDDLSALKNQRNLCHPWGGAGSSRWVPTVSES